MSKQKISPNDIHGAGDGGALLLLSSVATLRWAEWPIPMFALCPRPKLNLAFLSLFINDWPGSHGGEQRKCPGWVAGVDIWATHSSGLLCVLCVHPSGPTASSSRGLLVHQGFPASWFSGFPKPSSRRAVLATKSFCFPQSMTIHKETHSRDP